MNARTATKRERRERIYLDLCDGASFTTLTEFAACYAVAPSTLSRDLWAMKRDGRLTWRRSGKGTMMLDTLRVQDWTPEEVGE